MATKTKWVKDIPTEEGWYWIKYRNKHNRMSMCPCSVIWINEAVIVTSARNTTFCAGPNHGGPELKYDGKVDKSVRFGPKIPEPE